MAISPVTGSAEFFKSIRSINSAKKSSTRKIDTPLSGRTKSSAADISKLSHDNSLRSKLEVSSTISQNLANLKGSVSTAQSGVSGISELANSIQEKLIMLADTDKTDRERNSISMDLKGLLKQVQSFVENSQFNDTNLIKANAQNITVEATAGGENILVRSQGSLGVAVNALEDAITDGGRINDPLSILQSEFKEFEVELSSAEVSLAEAERAITIRENSNRDFQETVIQNLGNILEMDIARNTVGTAARSVQAQLSNQSLSITNSVPSSIIRLFR